MKKKLVATECLDEHIFQADKTLYADQSIILTPGAKDELARQGVTVVYGPKPEHLSGNGTCPAGCTCTACAVQPVGSEYEQLFYAMAAMLQTEYGITDQEELRKISAEALKIIKENI